MNELSAQLLCASEVHWSATGDGEHPYRFEDWTVRVNDFPEEPLYSLLHKGSAVLDLDDWPEPWLRP